ncbi:Hpt domain-containing protein [Salidesulfovibrio onnuriiensis]|uniref:Hpt domain-containing protein n=1 Tax=Salidesulfovibrio onnuriiensis TaxID=2583823 RepID=UPI0011CA94F7|nr:Hpt domain-containing protein [Salidesulfovibrio onnuriiensis]
MPEKDVIDSQFLESMAKKKPFLKKMFAVFVSQEPHRVQQIKDALDAGDVDQLRHLAHSLKGGAATMGAERVRECCLLLETATKDNDMGAARTHLQCLENEMNNAYTFMFNYMADN